MMKNTQQTTNVYTSAKQDNNASFYDVLYRLFNGTMSNR